MTLRTSLAAIIITLAGLFSAPAALAQQELPESPPDVVILKDGRELKGMIIKEQNGYIWLDVGVGQELFLSPDKIQSFTRTSVDQPSDENLQGQTFVGEPEVWERVPGVTRAAVLTAEGMVGMQFAAKPLREAIPMLKAEGIDLVVIRVNSGGGLFAEFQAISDVLHEEYKPGFQTVGWVDSAASLAGLTISSLETLYFRPRGYLGAATHSNLHTIPDIDRVIATLSERGGQSPLLFRAICNGIELSYSVDQKTGDVTFHQDRSGEHLLNDGTDLLGLNATDALRCGFSAGTADTLEELTALLEPEHGKIVWVGQEFEGIPYPLCMAERYQRNWREEIDNQDEQLSDIFAKYMMELGNAQSVPVDSRGDFLRNAEGYLARMRQMVEINSNLGLMNGIDDDWFENQDEIIRRLRTQ